MPKIWNCHTGLEIEKTFNESPFLKNKMVTFGSFNNFDKINTSVVETWSRILKKVDNSKLILKSSRPRVIELLSEQFKNQGVLNSVEFMTTITNFEDHMHLYKKIDIALDTFPRFTRKKY